ncbi:hypothetical protein AUK22_02770 [bacterium CG2_30_54_10]|nr:MAG: hypothetical protein AUK22_02770 [bacterium CG2_30_54_10]
MTKLVIRRIAAITVFSFIMILACAVAAQAASKQEIFDLSQDIKALQKSLKEAQCELRRLNEEGTQTDQLKAQDLMASIKDMREKLSVLQDQLNKAKQP